MARYPLPLLVMAMVTLCLSPWAMAAEALQSKPLRFGVLNQQSPIQTAEQWNPILRYLSRKSGIAMQLRMAPTVELTDAMMGREEFDLMFTNHNFQTEFDGKYKVLARRAGEPIRGVLVVLEESPVRRLRELQDRAVAFPSIEAFVAYAVPTVALKKAGVTVAGRFAGNQDGALAQLKARQVDAAAVNSRFLASYAQREGLRYRLLYQSEPFQEMPVLVHPRVPGEQADALKRALIEMRGDPEAEAILKAARNPGFVEAEERNYDNVRAIYRMIGQ